MARISTPRTPAAPSGHGQRLRRDALLRAAADLGSQHGFDGVQMQDIAREAGVALGTLYRYFPSKTALFLAVMGERVYGPELRAGAETPTGSVADLLIGWARRFWARPELGKAMLQSTLAAYDGNGLEAAGMDVRVVPVVLGRMGVTDVDDEGLICVRLMLYAWWGVVTAHLSAHMSEDQAERHIRHGVRLLADQGRSLPMTGNLPADGTASA